MHFFKSLKLTNFRIILTKVAKDISQLKGCVTWVPRTSSIRFINFDMLWCMIPQLFYTTHVKLNDWWFWYTWNDEAGGKTGRPAESKIVWKTQTDKSKLIIRLAISISKLSTCKQRRGKGLEENFDLSSLLADSSACNRNPNNFHYFWYLISVRVLQSETEDKKYFPSSNNRSLQDVIIDNRFRFKFQTLK